MSVEDLGNLYRSVMGGGMEAASTASSQFELVREFLVLKQGVKPHKVKPNTQLERDLKITGDEARALMQAFAERFSVDMQSFNADTYFSKRGGIFRKWEDMLMVLISLLCVLLASIELWFLLVPLVIAVGWNSFFANKALKPLTVQMLSDAAESKRWPEIV